VGKPRQITTVTLRQSRTTRRHRRVIQVQATRQKENGVMALNPLSNIRSIAKPFAVEVGDVALHVRQLGTSDSRTIEQYFSGLAPLDRRARFFGKLSDEAISAYAQRLDPSRALLIGAFDPSGRLVGLAEANPTNAVRTVEVAVSIDPAFRHRRLGQRLVARALIAAFARGAQSAEFNFAPGNRPVVSMVRTLGGRFGPKLGYASVDSSNWHTRQAA
jgi:ribosomal protein S18 acetylase RimI-like enzyme